MLDFGADEAALNSHPNPFATVVLAHLKTLAFAHDDEARRVSQVRLVKGLYERGFSAEQIRQLYRLMEGMMDLPARLSLLAWEEIRDFVKAGSLIEFSPVDDRLAIASTGSVVIRSINDESLATVRLPMGAAELLATAFSPDGRTLAVATDDGHVRLFDSMTGKRRRRPPRPAVRCGRSQRHRAARLPVAERQARALVGSAAAKLSIAWRRISFMDRRHRLARRAPLRPDLPDLRPSVPAAPT